MLEVFGVLELKNAHVQIRRRIGRRAVHLLVVGYFTIDGELEFGGGFVETFQLGGIRISKAVKFDGARAL